MEIKQSENEIQNTICEYLEILETQNKLMYWRQNTSPVYDVRGGSFRKMSRHAKKGVPDILVIIKGKFLGLEVKSKVGKPSSDQLDFKRGMEKNGAMYHVVRSLEDVLSIIKAI